MLLTIGFAIALATSIAMTAYGVTTFIVRIRRQRARRRSMVSTEQRLAVILRAEEVDQARLAARRDTEPQTEPQTEPHDAGEGP